MTAAIAGLIEASRQTGSILPIPFILLVMATVLSASIGGVRAGLASAVVWAIYVIYAATVPFGPKTLTGGPGQVSLGILAVLCVVLRQGLTSDRNRQLTQTLKTLNESLDSQVKDRTAKLSATNARLRQEIQERNRVDVALQRLTAKHIQHEPTLLEQILENILAGYWNWDIPNHQEYLSPGFKRMFGYEDHELPNTPDTWQNLIFPEDLNQVLSCFERHVQSHGKTPYYNEVRYRHKDGSTVWVICSGQVITWDQAGNPLRMIGCHIDISARKHAEDQVKRYMTQLEVSNQELEAFAYSVSHDLRAPLRAINGYSHALLEDYGNTLEQAGRDYLERISVNATQMDQLINSLLNLSRLSRTEVCGTMVNLSAIAQAVMMDLHTSDPERSVEQTITPELRVYADAALMQVVLTNLLQNAWKFTSTRPVAHIEFGVISSDKHPVYFVRDNGVGFNSAYRKMLFGVFERLHTHHEFPGTGVGLATVQRIVHRHGGKIWAEGAVEQGATFYFTIPHRSAALNE